MAIRLRGDPCLQATYFYEQKKKVSLLEPLNPCRIGGQQAVRFPVIVKDEGSGVLSTTGATKLVQGPGSQNFEEMEHVCPRV